LRTGITALSQPGASAAGAKPLELSIILNDFSVEDGKGNNSMPAGRGREECARVLQIHAMNAGIDP